MGLESERALAVLRPRSASELLDAAFALTRAHFAPFLVLAALNAIAGVLVSLAAGLAGIPTNGASWGELGELLVGMALGGLLTGAGTVAAADAYLVGRVDLGSALRRAVGRAWTLAWVGTLAGFLVVLGFFRLLVPGILLLIRYFALWPAIMLEGLGGVSAFRRSRDLARGRKRKLFVVVGLATILSVALSVAGQIVFEMLVGDPRVAGMISGTLSALLWPLLTALALVAYYDARLESEGLDIEWAAAAIASPAASAPSNPAAT